MTLETVNGNTLRLDFSPPASTGGEEVDRYKVEYSKSPLVNEVQALTVSCESQPDVQVVTTGASAIPEVQLIHLKMDQDFSMNYPGMTVYEIQASGECPTLSVMNDKGVRHDN